VYQAGTLSGNPLSVAAGIKTLEIIKRDRPHAALEATTAKLVAGLDERAAAHGVAWTSCQVGAMWGFFFQAEPVHDYAEAKRSDLDRFARFHTQMLAHGVYLAPSQFEAAFVSTAHDAAAIEQTLDAANTAFAQL
jgi:glutamate-1-semialdehyde 2,1-aminomutase